jgi:hypothetical protein
LGSGLHFKVLIGMVNVMDQNSNFIQLLYQPQTILKWGTMRSNIGKEDVFVDR